jgi:exopolyphosphatase / guanosine-5'-triphosphate,3'-diphosphate pyrophosphatase
MKIAAIDVGTNSFHLIVAHVTEDGSFEIIERAKEMVRLGERTLAEGVIPPEAFHRAAEALKKMRQIVERHRCEEIIAHATSAVREAHNGGAFVRAMRDEAGIELQVVRGDDEARLIYLGARRKLDFRGRRALIADIGGGSVELIVADAKEIYLVASLKLGVLRLSQLAVSTDPISAEERARLLERLHDALDPFATRARAMGFDFLALTSGTALTLAQLAAIREAGQPLSPVHGARLSFASLYALERELSAMPREQRALLSGLDPKRVDTIVPGAILLKTLYEVLAVDEATLCDSALREGMVYDYIARNRGAIHLSDEIPDLRRRSVMQLARKCRYPEVHSHQVSRLSLSLFRQTRDLHGLSNQDSQILEYAALLHDVGFHVSRAQHHKHSHYLIESCLRAGFEPREVGIISNVARYHRKSTPKKGHDSFVALQKADQKKVLALASLLRIADGLDHGHNSVVRQARVAISAREVRVEVHSHDDPELEIWGARRKGDLFEDLFGKKLSFVPVPAEEVQEIL